MPFYLRSMRRVALVLGACESAAAFQGQGLLRRLAGTPLSRVGQSAPAYQLDDVAAVDAPSAAAAARRAAAVDASPRAPERLPGGLVPVVELRNGCVLVDGVPLLTGLPPSLYQASPRLLENGQTAAAAQGGVMLGVNFALEDNAVAAALDDPAAGWRAKGAASLRQVVRRARRAQHDVLLGRLRANKILAASRIKRWWMAPSWPLVAGQVPIETQFALVGLPDGAGYAVLLPLVSGRFRATLYGTSGRGPLPGRVASRALLRDAQDLLSLRVESGDTAVRTVRCNHALYVAAGRDLDELLARAFREVAARTGTFNVRADKVPPPLLHKFGWCTWDAFYSSVRPEGVLAGLKGLALGGVPAKFLILDDGWQSVGNPAGRGRGRGGKAAAAAGAARVEAAAAEVGASRSGSTNSSTSSSATSASSTTATTTTTTTSSSSSSSAEATNLSGTTLTGNVGATLAVEVSNPVAAWLTAACGAFYANHVEHAPPGAWTVKLWSFLVRRTLLRASLLQFFDTFTDFSKRLTSFRANAKFERPSAAQGGLPGDPGATFKAFVRAAKQGSHSNASPSSSGSNGVDLVYCWHALPGYWGGVSLDAPAMKALAPFLHLPQPSPFLREIEPSMLWDPSFLGGVGALRPEKALGMYQGLHAYLAESGVDGVKVDAQSGLGALAAGIGGGPHVVRQYTAALEASVRASFGAQHAINCMCHSTENLYAYQHTAMARASDDFYPKDSASQTWHVAAVACNSLFIGEIAHTDWDMFHSQHPAAGMHAAARAVGGCAVYTSDAPGRHDFALLRSLALPDGTVPVASRPGRPTADALFCDPTRGGRAFKVRNVNGLAAARHGADAPGAAAAARSGVVAAFNLQGSAWDRAKRLYAFFEDTLADTAEALKEPPSGPAPLAAAAAAAAADPGAVAARRRRAERRASTTISAADVWPTLALRGGTPPKRSAASVAGAGAEEAGLTVAAWSFVAQRLRVLAAGEAVALDLAPKEFEVVTMVPLQRLKRGAHAAAAGGGAVGGGAAEQVVEVAWAPVGLAGMMNAGGTVVADSAEHASSSGSGPVARVRCMGPGRFLAYASARPAGVAVAVATEGNDPGTLVPVVGGAEAEKAVAFDHDAATGALFVALAATGHHDITVRW